MSELISWNPEDIDIIIQMIQNDKHQIVPVIGSDVFYVKQKNDEILLDDYIFQAIVDKFIESDFKEKVFNECTGSHLRRMKKLQDRLKKYGRVLRGKTPSIYSCVASLMTDISFKRKIQLRESVRVFLQNGNFPLIVTTCYIDILEEILMAPHGKRYQREAYYCQETKDISIPISTPAIFHLFGISESGSQPMITEDDFLKYLHFMHSDNAPHKLKNYLETRTVIALGCNIPDWTFRFVLLSLMEKGGEIKERTNLLGGAIMRDIEKDWEFREFLEEISYLPGGDIDKILEPINKRIYRPNLFLSYSAKENTNEWDGIQTILKKLESKYKVWFFAEQTKEEYGERYWDLIQNGLEECDYFMAVVTKDMIEKMKTVSESGLQKDKDAGFLWEWKMMMDEQKNRSCDKKAICFGYFLDSGLSDVQAIINNDTLPLQFLKPIFDDNENVTNVSPSNFDPDRITTNQIINN